MRTVLNKPAFTLVELLVAMTISAVILSAVATLAYALGVANDISDDTRLKQAQIRSATMRISELVRNSKMVLGTYTNTIAFWRCDLNNDNKINANEIVFLKTNNDKNQIIWKEYELIDSASNWTTTPGAIPTAENQLTNIAVCLPTTLIPACSNVIFSASRLSPNVPRSTSINVSFDISSGGTNSPFYLKYKLTNPSLCVLGPPPPPAPGNGILEDDD